MAAPTDALASIPDQGAQPQPDASQAQPAKPALWHRVLEGALAGLQTKTGVVAGALDPNTAIATKQNRMDMQAAKVRFANAQAASMVAQEHARQVMLQNQQEQIKTQQGELEEKVMKDLMDHGAVPSVTTNDGSDEAHTAGLEQLSNAHPNGVPGLIVFKLPTGQSVAFNLDNLGSNQAMLHEVNVMRKVQGNPPIDAGTFNNKTLTTPALKTKLMADASHFFTPVPKDATDLKNLQQAYSNYLANAKMLPSSDPDKAELVSRLQQASDLLSKWEISPKTQKPQAGTVNGQPAFARDGGPGVGWVDTQTGQPLPGFKPAQNYAQVAENVANLRNETQTKEKLMPDGVHLFAYNPQTKQYDRDQGLAGTGAQGNRGSAASSSVRMGEDLITDLQANKDKLGNLSAWVQKYGLNTPVADPKLAQLQSELSSFAALQPVQHGFRSTDALKTFEAIIGGLQKNPEATIASIRGLIKTSGAINPTINHRAAHKSAPAPAAAAPQQAPTAGGKAAQFGQTF